MNVNFIYLAPERDRWQPLWTLSWTSIQGRELLVLLRYYRLLRNYSVWWSYNVTLIVLGITKLISMTGENPRFYLISCNDVSFSHKITYVFAERIVMSYWASVWTGHACLQATMQRLCVPVSLQRIQIPPASHSKHFLSLVTTLICSHKMKWAHPVRVILAITVRCAPSTGIVLLVDLVHPIGALQVRGAKCCVRSIFVSDSGVLQ